MKIDSFQLDKTKSIISCCKKNKATGDIYLYYESVILFHILGNLLRKYWLLELHSNA